MQSKFKIVESLTPLGPKNNSPLLNVKLNAIRYFNDYNKRIIEYFFKIR